MASRTTTSSSSATKSGSRTPNTSSGSSGYDYDAAERARLEAQRKKEIEENSKYIKDIQETQGEIKELRDQISEAKALLANAVSGEKYNEYIKDLEEQDKCLAQISSDLNGRAKQAAINIRKRGAECIFCEKNTEPAHNTSRDNNRPLSVNTDELQKAVVMLTDINTRSKSICDKVSDITGDSKKLGIQNSDNSEDKSRNVVDITVTLRDKLQQQIKETERTEKENLGIVDKIYDWFSGLFKSSDDKKLKDLGTDAARAEQFAIKNNSAKLTPGSRTVNAAPRDISELKGMSEIITAAKANDVSTKGKSKREILEELAIKLGIPITADPTKKQSRLERTTNEI